MRFEEYILKFEDYLKTKAFSENTLRIYLTESKKFIKFVEEYYSRIKNITAITKDIVFDYASFLTGYKDKTGKLLSNKTQILKLIVLKRFFKFLLKNDFIIKDSTASLELPKEEKSLPRNVPTENEIMQVLDSCNARTPIGFRNRAIIELAYSTGMRTCEITKIKIQDLDLKNQTAMVVLSKNKKSRLVPLGQYCCFYIEEYLNKARKFLLKGINKDSGYLFITTRGTKYTSGSLNNCVIKSIMKNVKLNKKITCYSFRHGIATALIKNKVDIKFVGELLGHSSIRTTVKYCHLDVTDLKKIHSLYHPREIQNNTGKINE